MDNKLSELSKPVGYFIEWQDEETGEKEWCECSKQNGAPLYSQEYVSALDKVAQYWIGESAGWKKRAEDAEKRIAELEAKLATPIKIVNYDEFFICHVSGASDDYCKGWVDGRNAAARDVGKAGFTVEDK
ncbi:hypothetical protein [Serratia marcescens]|uniref:hypothetical protein n=1 Tax=Serratia marcescens TaxID=615 RepID=UPI0027602D04|nr:hypothetical protein [Serratia marcescens]MDP8730704.1 hypothetical protein [Serratia marcescens]